MIHARAMRVARLPRRSPFHIIAVRNHSTADSTATAASHSAQETSTIDPAEVSKFSRLASTWWDTRGPFAQLHRMNPVRVEFVTRQVARGREVMTGGAEPLRGLRVLDVGCGGGILSEVRRSDELLWDVTLEPPPPPQVPRAAWRHSHRRRCLRA